jgi:hypothetical protein
LIYFLIAQFIAIGAGAASILAYAVKLETRVSIMEERGAAYTVSRMDQMKLQIHGLEQQIENNENSIKRIVDVMTRELGKDPRRTTP